MPLWLPGKSRSSLPCPYWSSGCSQDGERDRTAKAEDQRVRSKWAESKREQRREKCEPVARQPHTESSRSTVARWREVMYIHPNIHFFCTSVCCFGKYRDLLFFHLRVNALIEEEVQRRLQKLNLLNRENNNTLSLSSDSLQVWKVT